MSSIMRRRSGLMGRAVAGVWLIGGVLVLEVEVANPLILKTGHFQSRYRTLALTSLPAQSANRRSPRATGWRVAPSFHGTFAPSRPTAMSEILRKLTWPATLRKMRRLFNV